MSSPPAPSPLVSLLRDLGGLAALVLVALALLALSIWLESPPGHAVGPFEWLASLDADRAASLLGVAAQLVAGVLAIVITVAAIVVELAANRYTSRITQLFVREPVNFLLMGFYVVTTLLCLWLSGLPDLSAEGPPRVPRAGLVIGLALVSLCLAALLPYFGFLFRFLEPTNVIHRIRGLAVERIQRARTRSVPGTHAEVIEAIEELEDVARSAREHSDRSISMAAISALAGLLREYAPLRDELPASWFAVEGSLAHDPDFVSMAPVALAEIREQRIWLETKVLRQYLALFGESLGDARDIANLIALETRQLGIESVGGHPALLDLVTRFFNSFLRAAVNAHDLRSAYYVLDQYRLLGEAVLAAGDGRRTLEIAGHLRFYGQLAYEMGQSFLLEAVAYDLARLVERAVEADRPEAAALLDLFLQVDREPESPEQEERLRGVRRAQVQLATFFLARGDEPRARRIFEDMKDERRERLVAVRDELVAEERAQYWEFTDRGVNFSYLPPERRVHLAKFFSWFSGALALLVASSASAAAGPRSTSRAPSPTGPRTGPTPAASATRRSRRSRPRTWARSRSPGSTTRATCSTARSRSARARSRSRRSSSDGTLFFCTPLNRVFALDPETGRERWTLRPAASTPRASTSSTAAASRPGRDERAPRRRAAAARASSWARSTRA